MAEEAVLTTPEGSDPHLEHGTRPYMVVFSVLLVCTALSFVANRTLGAGTFAAFAIILGIALCKAVLVAMFFMHLNFDWGKLYFIIIPVVIMGMMMMVVLLPDIVLAWHRAP